MNVNQLFDLTGRVAIVSGGSMGLGRQMAEGLAEMGANLVLCARKKERWAGVIDSVGSHTLANACAQTRYRGIVAACGLAQGLAFGADLPNLTKNSSRPSFASPPM